MTVEIRELVIRASVADNKDSARQLEETLARLKADILRQCLEQIREQRERSSER